ncbi:aminoacyl-tRNA ligase [Cucumis melo var. makuwa]|uniref:Aminoacyl-tRNA ligase n=1 Tax=Cucumis melo var. makuwa TaxID=1194695 RepID=A0A5D3BJD9_CUCMM|nr:aminoacyl-tRNA ligase [Cucumis melo var. makuwa]TYJ99393.1 aminoacyl-tRNA ligase [Cucumis melo var. makuwa]
MENPVEALDAKLKKVEDEEVHNIPTTHDNNLTTLMHQMALLLNGHQQCLPQYAPTHRMPNLELPMFDGTDTLMWILKMERYFEVHHIDDIARMMDTILLCMSGQALAWFRCFQNWGKPPESWDEFRDSLYMRFGDARNVCSKFLGLEQEGSVEEYCSKFETLGALLPELQHVVLEAKFMNGLKTEIREDVRMLHPKDILDIMHRARLGEKKNNVALNSTKRKGTVKERSVIVKVVSWTDYNLISKNLATDLKLKLDMYGDYSVVLGSGKKVKGDGICRGVLLQIGNDTYVEDFFPLQMGEDDEVILGNLWLVALGKMEVDWKNLPMKLKVGKETVTLRKDPFL